LGIENIDRKDGDIVVMSGERWWFREDWRFKFRN
jgi:hypothetical protein